MFGFSVHIGFIDTKVWIEKVVNISQNYNRLYYIYTCYCIYLGM